MAFILVGLGLLFGFGPVRAAGFSNFSAHGGFLPHGLRRRSWLAMTLTPTSHMGVEIIGVTAGETAQTPNKPSPAPCVPCPFGSFFSTCSLITGCSSMTPLDRMGSVGYRQVLLYWPSAAVGVPFAGSIMNLVVITAAFQARYTNLYLTTRTLFSLSRDGYVSETLGRLGKNGVPYFLLLLVSTGGMVAAILLAIFCSRTGIPAALRCRGRRHVLRMDRGPARTPCLSPLAGPRASRSAADPPAVLALLGKSPP